MNKPRLYTIVLLCSAIVVLAVFGIVKLTEKKEPVPSEPASATDPDASADPAPQPDPDPAPDASEPEPDASVQEPEPPADVPPAPPTIGAVAEGYFDDALFIGDSRTVGLAEYGGLDGASFFANVGMSVYKVDSITVDFGDEGELTLEQLLSSHTYGKIYLMLGINELGYNQSTTLQRYSELVQRIRTLQPDAYILLEANLHVGADRSDSDDVINNPAIDSFNAQVAALADNETIFYLDVNSYFDDEDGNLKSDCTSDGVHVYGKYYAEWGEWLRANGVVPAA